jgi:hypothetical protein
MGCPIKKGNEIKASIDSFYKERLLLRGNLSCFVFFAEFKLT